MTEEANGRLKQFLNDGRNWEKKATNDNYVSAHTTLG
jgi:hypothetical protein